MRQESKEHEIALLDDDPDALVAMLRHLYNFWLMPPPHSLALYDKVRYYCHVVVVADKYALPALTQEALKSLTTFLTSIEDAKVLLASLKILTDEFSDHSSLDDCATTQAKPRLKDLVAVPGFPIWISLRSKLLHGLVDDAATLGGFKKTSRYRCFILFACYLEQHTTNLLQEQDRVGWSCVHRMKHAVQMAFHGGLQMVLQGWSGQHANMSLRIRCEQYQAHHTS